MRLSFLAALSAAAAVSANNAIAAIDKIDSVSFMKNVLASPHFEQFEQRRRTEEEDMMGTDICDSMCKCAAYELSVQRVTYQRGFGPSQCYSIHYSRRW